MIFQKISNLAHLFIKEAKALTVDPSMATTMCYFGTADLESTALSMYQWFAYFIGILLPFILAVKNSIQLLKRKTFSVYYGVYKSFKPLLISLIIISIILFVSLTLITDTNYETGLKESILQINERLAFIGIVILIMFGATALGHLLFSVKNFKFFLIAFSFALVIPSIVIFLIVVIKNRIPSLKNTLPPDAITTKKEDLKNKLEQEGKLPPDQNKNHEA